MTTISITATASVLPERTVSNVEIGEMLIQGSDMAPGMGSGMGSGMGPDMGPDMDDESTAELVKMVRQRSALIEKKTGLRSRRFFAPDIRPVSVGLDLLEQLAKPEGNYADIDAIIVSSSSNHGFPGISQQIVAEAKATGHALDTPFVLDIGSNACTGFMYALTIGTSLIKGLGYRRVACLGIEFASRCIAYDPLVFGTSTLFGDAASGVMLEADRPGLATLESVRATSMIDRDTIGLIRGGGMDACFPDRPVSREGRWFMAGPPVAVGATKILAQEIKRYQAQGHNIDWLIPHQANLTRILLPACKKAGIPEDRLCASFAETGNTSSASIPLLLDELVSSGRARPGDKVLMIGFGASFSVGSALAVIT